VQELQAGAAVYLPLDHFEPVNLAFDLAVAPRAFDGGKHSRPISLETERKPHQRSNAGKFGNLNPVTHPMCVSAGQGSSEIQRQRSHPVQVRTTGRKLIE
jgi:hypothetical protein